VSQDQEAKWEASRKIKRKVDLLAVSVAKQLHRPSVQAMAEEKAIPIDGGQCPQNGLTLDSN
jgi:hypothetical protein